MPSHVLRDASEVRYYTALGWQHVNTMFSSQISWKKLSRKVLYTARRAREESSNEVLRKRFAGLKTAKIKRAPGNSDRISQKRDPQADGNPTLPQRRRRNQVVHRADG